MNKSIGLRERKKQQTKDAILKSAYYLFSKKGYENTSIEEITIRANFAPRTFFLHFDSKEDLLFPYGEKLKQSLTAAFAERGDSPALRTFKQWELTTAVEIKIAGNPKHETIRRNLIATNRQLQARLGSSLKEIEALLATELAKERKLKTPDLTARVVAAAVMAIFIELYEQGIENLPQQEIAKTVNDVTNHLRDIL